MGVKREDYDAAWKQILEWFFPQLITLCFPQVAVLIDWSHPPEFLDTELIRLFGPNKGRRRHLDKLVKLRLRGSGKAVLFLLHLEIQGQKEKGFPKRMLYYFFRIAEDTDLPVMQIAILADPVPDWRPHQWEHRMMGMHLSYNFPIIKVLDFDPDELAQQSNNPAAVVLLACQKAILTQRGKDRFSLRLQWKKELIQLALQTQIPEQDLERLLLLINHLMLLSEDKELQFNQWLHHNYHHNNPPQSMVKLYSFETLALKRGRAEGSTLMLRRLLNRKFGSATVKADWVQQKLKDPTEKELRRWADRILDVETIEEVFAER